AALTAWIWFCFFSGYSFRARRWTFFGTFAVLAVLFALFRVVEVTGSMVPTFAWRWTWRAPDHALGKLELSPTVPIDLARTTPDDFSQFLGPERGGCVAGRELAGDWSAEPPVLVCERPIGAGW